MHVRAVLDCELGPRGCLGAPTEGRSPGGIFEGGGETEPQALGFLAEGGTKGGGGLRGACGFFLLCFTQLPNGTVSPWVAGGVLEYGSGVLNLEGFWARPMGTEA